MTEDSLLVQRARDGDTGAFEELVRRYVVMTYRVALRVVGNAEDAQDVSQQALLSAWQGLAGFRGDAAFSSWLHQITRRHALNCAVRKRPVDVLAPDEHYADPRREPAEVCETNAAALGLYRAVAALPEIQQRALNLRHFEGCSYEAISDAIGSTVPAVRSHLYRARRSLATALGSEHTS